MTSVATESRREAAFCRTCVALVAETVAKVSDRRLLCKSKRAQVGYSTWRPRLRAEIWRRLKTEPAETFRPQGWPIRM
eukprot:3285507-Pyramimonas_sp.AAC.1